MNHRPAIAHAEALCRQRGVRLTPQRRQVLQLLLDAQRPLSAYELLEGMHTDGRRPAPPTVYRALDFLLEQGFAHKLESLHAYIGCPHPGHPHAGQFLVCTACGQVDEVCEAHLGPTLEEEIRRTGFQLQRRVIELLGLCAGCRPQR